MAMNDIVYESELTTAGFVGFSILFNLLSWVFSPVLLCLDLRVSCLRPSVMHRVLDSDVAERN